MNYYHKYVKTAVGELKLISSDVGLVALLWEDDAPDRVPLYESVLADYEKNLLETELQLKEYFAKTRTAFDIRLDLKGTDFQLKVWQALLTIPFAETRTYGQVAAQLNNLGAVRAVGAAANKNPVSIIVPCHRVIGASGKLVGFAGGLQNKSMLLQMEHSLKNPTLW